MMIKKSRFNRLPLALIVLTALVFASGCSSGDSEAEPTSSSAPPPVATSGAAAVPQAKQYEQSPPVTIDASKRYTATIVTDVGDIVLELYADKTPLTVNNFVFLARDGYYNNTTFHRVLAGFMAQAGDPTGTGRGGPGYTIPDESVAGVTHDAGVISMANVGLPNTGGSQFFITFVPTPFLDGHNADGTAKQCALPNVSCHTVFGRVIDGQDALSNVRLRDPDRDPNPGTGITTIRITEE